MAPHTRFLTVPGEALPLRWDALVGLERVAGREADNQPLLAVEKSRRVEFGEKGLVHSNRLHELDVGRKPTRAQRFWRRPELPVERSGEGFMRAVAGGKADLQDVG